MSLQNPDKKVTSDLELSAAQETVQVLKNKVFQFYNSNTKSVIHAAVEGMKKREEEQKKRLELAEVRGQELQKYSQTLEGEVKRRTESIKSILDNVKFGFLTVDKDFTVQDECTKTCFSLLGVDKVARQNLTELFRLNKRDSSSYRAAADQIFEDILPEEVSVKQLRSLFHIDNRTLKAEPSPIRDAKGNVLTLLYTISDVTDLQNAQKEVLLNRALINILREKEAFKNFLSETRKLIKESSARIKKGETKDVRRLVHTIKGNCSLFLLQDIVELIHELESGEVIGAKELDTIETAMNNFLKANDSVINIEREEKIEISLSQAADLKKLLSSLEKQTAAPLNTWYKDIQKKPATQMIGPMAVFVERLAQRLKKNVNFEFLGGQILLDNDRFKEIFQNIPHLIRNSMDHGIELPEQRGKKSPKALLRLQVIEDHDEIRIEVSDDGRGINAAKVTEKAIAAKLITPKQAEKMSEVDKYHLIFLEGISTAEETTDISGRGVGMTAIQVCVKAAGGNIKIKSDPGKGTLFTLEFPK